jgi:hypothetical protein
LPALPQADGSVPLRQSVRPVLSTEQHPLGHVPPLHTGSMRPHTWVDVHMLKPVAMQSEQLSPTEPHARMSLPVWHTPLRSQQPFGHVDALHAGGPASTTPESSVSGSRLVLPQPGPTRMKKSVERANRAKARKARRGPNDPR